MAEGTARLPTPDDPDEGAPVEAAPADTSVARETPAPADAGDVARETPKPGKSTTDNAKPGKRSARRVGDLPPLPSDAPAKPAANPEQEQRERAARNKRIDANHRRNLAVAKRWGKRLQALIDRGTTATFAKVAGIDYRYDTEALRREGINVEVLATIVPTADDVEAVYMTVGEAVAYHAAGLGLRSFEDFIAWLHDHPVVMAIVGLAAVAIQHGLLVKQVADKVVEAINRQNAAANAANAASVAAHNAATAGSQPFDATSVVVVNESTGEKV